MRGQQAYYVRNTMTARFQDPIALRGEIQFWSFLAEKVSPDFLPRNSFNLPRLDFLPPSFCFSSPGSFSFWIGGFSSFKAFNKQPDKRGSIII